VSKKLLLASTIGAVAKSLSQVCESNDAVVAHFKQGEDLIRELVEGKYDALLVEHNFLEGECRDLLPRIRRETELQDLFVIVYAPANLAKDEMARTNGSNAVLTAPFTDAKITVLFKRAFSLPKQCLFVSGSTYDEFSLALANMGYDFKSLSSGEAVLDDTSPDLPDFVIAEYNLPGMSGLKFLEKARESERFKNVPVLIAYNGREVGDIESILKAGVDEVILSPFASARNLKRIQDRFPLPPKGRRLRALVVDDSPTIRDLVSSMFEELDYHVETAENGFEGYKAVQRLKPDIITSDYDMPVLNGWEFCTEVRDHEEYRDIPIIMITTRATELDMKKGELLGVSAYLAKPFQKDTLKAAVEVAIANARTKREQETIAKFVAADTMRSVNNMVEGMADASKGESKFITVLFSDICAFSGKCEKFSARKIINLLNTYFDLMVEVLSKHGAIIDKFIGDAIVARFDSGDPEVDALNAVRGAWGMCLELERFNLDSFEEVQSRIGINSGEVILGNLGCERHRLEYAMIGDNVNIGQRLESSAPKQGVMISETTYELVKDKISVGERQEIEVKGKKEKVAAYVLEGIK
jgi:adenylate cyclase